MFRATCFSAVVVAATMLTGTDAHGFVSLPKSTTTGGSQYTSFSAEFTGKELGDPAFASGAFNRSPQQNAQEFTGAFKNSKYKDLRSLIDSKVSGCGHTDPNGAVQDVSNIKTLEFQNNEYKEGFLGSHEGPCEAWIDDTRVFSDDNCAKNFKSFPAKLPVDYSKCSGNCRLTFYWLALHSVKWQAYKYCVPIKNGARGAAAGGNNAGNGNGAAAGGNAAGGGGNAGGNAGGNSSGNGGGNGASNSGNGASNGGNSGSPSVTPTPATTKPPVVAPEAAAPSKKSCKRRQRVLSIV